MRGLTLGTLAAMAAALSLSGCGETGRPTLSVPPADPEIARLDGDIATRAQALYAALPAKTAPDCAYDANMAAYAAMTADVDAMKQHAATRSDDGAMQRASTALAETIAKAEESHKLASAKTDDRFGACMAPGAITLNADAIARATKAIADLQTERSR